MIKDKIYKTLRISEKYTKTDMLYLTKGGFWLALSQIISMVAVFISSVAFANLLPKEIYGTYKYVISIFSILSIATLQGVNTALIRSVAQGFETSLDVALKTKLKFGVLGGIGSLVVAMYYFWNGNITLTLAFAIVAIFTPLIDAIGVYEYFLQGKKLFKDSAIYSVVAKIITTIILVLAIYYYDNVIVILLAFFMPLLLVRYVFLKLTIKKVNQNTQTDQGMISFGKHLSSVNVIATFARYIDSLLIFHFLGPVELAIYSFALAPADQIKNVLTKSVESLALPKFSQRSLAEIKKNIYPKMAAYGLLLSAIIIVYIVISPFVFDMFFPQYTESVFLTQVFSISILGLLATIPRSIMQSQKMVKDLYVFNTISAVIQIVMMFVLLYYFGLLGAILARVLGRFFTLFSSMYILHKAKTS